MRYPFLIIALLFFAFVSMAQRDSSAIKRCIPSPDIYRGQPVYTTAEQMPVFPTGNSDFMNYILKNLIYPESNQASSPIRSTFYVTCVIDTLGKAQEVCCITSYDYYDPVEKQLIELIRNSEGWTPGMRNGRKVCVRIKIPLSIHWK